MSRMTIYVDNDDPADCVSEARHVLELASAAIEALNDERDKLQQRIDVLENELEDARDRIKELEA